MHAVRQNIRPKHETKVLVCYPRFQKGVAEVKPNPNELSQLLYYASSRRTKVTKVCAFLEKKTASDVSRGRLGDVQVTSHIIRALIDKLPRDLPLYAQHVLRILQTIIKSKNLPMVEESVLTFQIFCEHHDAALLTADQDVSKDFENLVRDYRVFAGSNPIQSRTPLSRSVALKWTNAGLRAIKSITSSEAIEMNPRQYSSIILPVILEILDTRSNEELDLLIRHSRQEKEVAKRRRLSTATAQTAESVPDDHTISTTTADADQQAEDEVALMALQSLEQIFSSSNRLQLRWATTALLNFVVNLPLGARPDVRPGTAKTTNTTRTHQQVGQWTLTLVDMIATSTPVQDRFVIMVTTVEALVDSPIAEENLKQQLVLAVIIEWLLSSTINMIGLSVIDVLQSLIQHILLILQLGGRGTNVLPHHQSTDAIDLFDAPRTPTGGSRSSMQEHPESRHEEVPSATRQELLDKLQKCVGNLATHVYYSEQVRDIIREILQRLKPPSVSGVAGVADAIQNPEEAAKAIAESVNMNEDPETDNFFSFGTARVAALNAIRDVLIVANEKGVSTGAGSIGRRRVSVQLWEGTQWLLRDEDKRVRRAYVDALLTWLRLEMGKQDLRVIEEVPKSKKANVGRSGSTRNSDQAPSRKLSNASPNNRIKLARSTFLQLLHLAVYENVMEAPEEDSNILLMHLLLVSLTQKLGVNATKTGLPMIVRLQEDIITTAEINTPKAKINVGSLVHGYFWALTDTFDFDTTAVGWKIQGEVSRRQKAGLWLEKVKVPPQPLDLIIKHGLVSPQSIPARGVGEETLKPFDDIPALVAQIATSYAEAVSSRPSSPPQSPGRVFTMPLVSAVMQPKSTDILPPDFKDSMTSDWSKEACIADAEQIITRTGSPHGSRSGTTRTTRSGPNGLLTVDVGNVRDISPAGGQAQSRVRGRIPSAFMPLRTGYGANDSVPTTPVSNPASNGSDITGALRVDDLKRVLTGGALAGSGAFSRHGQSSVRTSSPLRNQTATQDFAQDGERLGRVITRPSIISTTTDNEGFESASEGDPDHPLPSPQSPADTSEVTQQYMAQLGRRPYEHSPGRNSEKARDIPSSPTSPSRKSLGRPRSVSETSSEDPNANYRALRGALPTDVVRGSIVAEEDVPPVPPLPKGLISKHHLGNTNGSNDVSSQASAVLSSAVLAIPDLTAKDLARGGSSAENRPKSVHTASSIGRTSLRDSTYERRSLRAAGSEKKSIIQELLGSINVDDVGGKGIGKPPY